MAPKKLLCEVCKKPFRRKDALVMHRQMKHDRENITYIMKSDFVKFGQTLLCDDQNCAELFSSIEEFTHHFKTVHGKRHMKSTVKILQTVKSPSDDLLRNKCVRCGTEFSSKKALKKHASQVCTRSVALPCKLCPEARFFFSHEELIQHTKTSHPPPKDFISLNTFRGEGGSGLKRVVENFCMPMIEVSLFDDVFTTENQKKIASLVQEKWQTLGGVKFRISCPVVMSKETEDGEQKSLQFLAPAMLHVPRVQDTFKFVRQSFENARQRLEMLELKGSGWR